MLISISLLKIKNTKNEKLMLKFIKIYMSETR